MIQSSFDLSQKTKLRRITQGRLRTNPVWTLQAFIQKASLDEKDSKRLRAKIFKWVAAREDEGFHFSPLARSHPLFEGHQWRCELLDEPRVVGLLVNNRSQGFVNPLITKRSSSGWRVTRNYLPFHVEQIQDALIKTLQESGLSLTQSVPELIGFSIQEQLNELSSGESMHIAGLLSVIDSMNFHHCDLFARACAIVMPQGNDLVPVDSIITKLDAFEREYGSASLLVAPQGFKIPLHLRNCFPENLVWRVNSFSELAGRLSEAGQLERFAKEFTLNRTGLEEARKRIRWLQETSGNVAALEFAERLDLAVNFQSQTSLRISQAIEHDLRELNRHVGRFAKAISHSKSGVQKLERMGSRISSFQEIVVAKTQFAASLFDGHDFDRGVSELSKLVIKIQEDPSLVTAEVEIELRNTLGRLQVMCGQDGWEEHFRCSEMLQDEVDRENISRTRCYLIRGLLRDPSDPALTEAAAEIKRLDELCPQGFARTELKFFAADMARRRGEIWADQQFEDDKNIFCGHPLGFYFQATARQSGRNPEDAAKRMEKAAAEFKKDIGEFSERNVLELFSFFVLWRRAIMLHQDDQAESQKNKIDEFLCHPDTRLMQKYYSNYIDHAEETNDFEPLFESVPYF